MMCNECLYSSFVDRQAFKNCSIIIPYVFDFLKFNIITDSAEIYNHHDPPFLLHKFPHVTEHEVTDFILCLIVQHD